MLKLLKLLGWTLTIVILLGAIDQIMVRVPLELPVLKPAQVFYVDFRSRLVGLFGGEPATELQATGTKSSIEQVIESSQAATSVRPQRAQRYLYVDETGALQFADSYSQVPAQYRKDAQPMAE